MKGGRKSIIIGYKCKKNFIGFRAYPTLSDHRIHCRKSLEPTSDNFRSEIFAEDSDEFLYLPTGICRKLSDYSGNPMGSDGILVSETSSWVDFDQNYLKTRDDSMSKHQNYSRKSFFRKLKLTSDSCLAWKTG